jgi:hypothetical protein
VRQKRETDVPRVNFNELPDHSRLWVFPVSRGLTDEETSTCEVVIDDFLAQWMAHGVPLRSAGEIRDQRFVLIGVDVDAEAPSGCSIDALMNNLRSLGDDLSVTFIDHSPVWYRDGEEIRSVPRREFRALAADGSVSLDTMVFDTSITTVAQERDQRLERPAMETWHGSAFFKVPV